jgi:hypothetical protein
MSLVTGEPAGDATATADPAAADDLDFDEVDTVPVAAFAPPLAPVADADAPAALVPATQPSVDLAHAVTASPPGRAHLWMDKAQAYLDRGSQATGLDTGTFGLIVVGLGAGLLVLIAACFTWYSFRMDMRLFGTPLSEGEAHSGISYLEGKLVFICALAGGVWVALGIWRKSWLPGAILAAGAAHTFALVILLGLRSRLAAAFTALVREQVELARFISGNPITKSLETVSKETDSTLLPALRGGAGWSLALAIFLTLAAAVVFAAASRRRPLTLAFLEKPGTAPFVQRYGTLAAAYGLAFLVGVIVVVLRH